MKDKMKLIVELFNADLDHIIAEVVTAKYVGASWILIPPQQEHLDYDNEWWSSYKPLGYKITEDTRERLQTLVETCTRQGINIMVDTVLNHTDPSAYKEGHKLFHPSNAKETAITRQWIFGLPDWNSLHPTVQKNGRTLIETYRSLGIKGFRFDAAPFIDHEFFDYVLKDSPEDEVHLYEVYGFDQKYVSQFLKRRLQTRPTNTLLYDFQEYFNANAIINKTKITNDDSFYNDTILPQYGVSMATNHDQILHNWNIKPIDMLTAGVLTTFMSCHDYLLTVVCVTSTVPACSIWSWETVERYFLPIINLKNKYGKSPSVIKTDEEGNILVAVNKSNMFFTFNRLYTSDVSKIPVNYVSKNFMGFNESDTLVNVFDGRVKGKHIPVPERNIVIGYNESIISSHNNLIHMFWYQGWDKVPEYCNKAVDLWKELGQVMLWDRDSVAGLMLSEKEGAILSMVEERFPVPEMYAAYADIARLIILSKYGGIYVDTDAYPNDTTSVIFDWLNTSNAAIFGKEPSGMVNNAVIIVPNNGIHVIGKLLDRILDAILEKWDDNILNFAGPQRIKSTLYQEKWTDYIILPVSWLYATLSVARNGVGENCTDELVLVQHCYAASWVSNWDSKYINYKDYQSSLKEEFTVPNRTNWILVIGLLLVAFILYKMFKTCKK